MKSQLLRYVIFGLALIVAGCSSQDAYRRAFDPSLALQKNTGEIKAPIAQVWDAARVTLTQQGFLVQQADKRADVTKAATIQQPDRFEELVKAISVSHSDQNEGLIRAARDMADPNDSNLTYHIEVTLNIGQGKVENTTLVSMAATEQTILHRKWHDWFHLFWLIPIFPTGTEYQTVVVHEGGVTDPEFYQTFFYDLNKAIQQPPGPAQSSG